MPATLKKSPAPELPVPSPTVDVARPGGAPPIDAALMKIVAATKSSPLRIMRDYASLAFGPGKVSFAEYVRLRLFDEAYYGGADRRAVIGWKRNSQINLVANFRHDWWGMLSDKIASASYLSAYGFPTLPIVAVFSRRAAAGSAKLLRDVDALRAFLTNEANYPLFGKPVEGLQSLGSIALRRIGGGELETVDGRNLALEDFVADIARHYADGYLFQKLAAPHPGVRAVCGERIATVRMVTITVDGEPRLFRACWKIPAGSNMADNFWRPGNLLAQIDPAEGKVLRAFSGAGLDYAEQASQPDTGAKLPGAGVPLWAQMKGLVLEAAGLMRHVPMIGWDVAALEDGPVIVEMNETPDLFLNQFADRRGVLDAEFNGFLEQQKRNQAAHNRQVAERNKNP
jgi:hypothetical protein